MIFLPVIIYLPKSTLIRYLGKIKAITLNNINILRHTVGCLLLFVKIPFNLDKIQESFDTTF